MIFGLSGTNGAGKDTVAEILRDNYGYLFISATDILRDEARKRGLDVSRKNLRDISAEWRREFGMGVLIDRGLIEYEKVQSQYEGFVISSLRHPAEADAIHAAGGKVIWVDADPQLRYQRVQSADRGRASEDKISFEEFLAHEKKEMNVGGDAATLKTAAVKEKSDVTLLNEDDGIEALKSKLASMLEM
ncbi:TPA: hypothetical protein EYO12_04235 [Candidatus Saccharibacteria bacterium]|nr:hypothetical protein [Candidatus Saccharibacteria bacterium]HIO87756.1 hypothetical protein [Candidatus Saccharibacteria bacterium]